MWQSKLTAHYHVQAWPVKSITLMIGDMKNYPAEDIQAFKTAFGGVLRELRDERGLSQQSLADAANLHRNHISFLERGTLAPSLFTVFQLAEVLKISPPELVAKVLTRLQQLSNVDHV